MLEKTKGKKSQPELNPGKATLNIRFFILRELLPFVLKANVITKFSSFDVEEIDWELNRLSLFIYR